MLWLRDGDGNGRLSGGVGGERREAEEVSPIRPEVGGDQGGGAVGLVRGGGGFGRRLLAFGGRLGPRSWASQLMGWIWAALLLVPVCKESTGGVIFLLSRRHSPCPCV
jgi:hypothetical protein